ncbi:MAG: response regulator [Firmicutes bacterium]|nr:response regulator [Bacillota bacterium]
MQIKDGLLKIKAINKNDHIAKLNENDFKQYVTELEKFCDTLPNYDETLKSEMKKEDYFAVANTLSELATMLKTSHALDLSANCAKQSSQITEQIKAKSIVPNELEDKIIELSRSLSEFSIDVQMALHQEEAHAHAHDENAMKFSDLDEDEPPPPPPEPKQTYTILAVDDVSFFLQIIRMHLQNTPFKATCVNSGKAALRFIDNHHVDLYILDIEMPEMNGYELAEKIRSKGKTEPIIFLTSNASRNDVIKAIHAGGSDFIIKPCNQQQILERIVKHLMPKHKLEETEETEETAEDNNEETTEQPTEEPTEKAEK